MRYLICLCALLLALPSSALAQRVGTLPALQPATPPAAITGTKIAAVVNDAIISTSDVEARIALALLSSGLPNSAEVRQKLLPQVLRTLIDEQLQLQEGKRLDIAVTQEEIDKALDRLAKDNNIPGGNMVAFLGSHGVPPSTLIAQARAALTWNKVAQRSLRPRVDIGDDEVDAAIERLRANAGKEEYLVSEIFLAVDNPKDEEQVKAFAENLVQQIKGGANFGAIARQFSQSTGAASGGDIGWIQRGQTAPELDKMLANMQAGEVAGPVRAANGFHILGVREKRIVAVGNPKDMVLRLNQAFLRFAPEHEKEAILKEAARMRQSVTTCDGLEEKLRRDYPAWTWQDLGTVGMDKAAPWLLAKVRDIPIGHASEPLATDKGALILFVCDRSAPDKIDRQEVMVGIGSERIELLARRLLRDLRRNAYLDVRMASAQ